MVGIIGVLGVSTVPALRERASHRRLEQASWQIYMDLQQAKARAVSENRAVRVSVNPAEGRYSIWVDSNGNGVEDAEETIVRDLRAELPGAGIDGTIVLGAAANGVGATVSGAGAIPVSRTARIHPDPLGAVGGALAASFTHYSNPLNNDNAAAGILNSQINLGSHGDFTLDSGVYYLNEFSLGSHAELHVESTPEDPAVIFLTGTLRCQPGTEFFSSSGSPRALYIFSICTSTRRF